MLGDIDPALVMIKDWNPVVYTGRDRVPTATFMRYDRDRRRDVPLDFSAATRMVLTLPAIDAVWDTLVAPGVMIGSADGSVRTPSRAPVARIGRRPTPLLHEPHHRHELRTRDQVCPWFH